MPLTNEQAAYIAGIVDGEGSISLVKSHARRTRGRYVYPLLRVANTDELLIDWLAITVGCGARQYRSAMDERCKNVFHICWASNEAIMLLKQILPYLLIKRDRARLVIHLWDTNEQARVDAGGYFGNHHRLPDWLVEKREEAFRLLAIANRRGV